MEGVVNKHELVEIRDGISDDHAFIYATWLKSVRHGNDYFGLIESDAYFKYHHKVIERTLEDFEVMIKVACLKEDPSVILGYSVYKNQRLDFVFIKKSWRNIGLAKDLVPKDITSVSHVTKVGMSLLRKHPQIVLNPYQES